MISADVAVIGAGIVGLSAAWRLARAGLGVVVLERYEIGHGRGSSHGPTRIFRFAYADPFYVRLAQTALPMWRELEDAPEEIVRITGGIDVGLPSFVEPIASALESCGAAAERLSAGARRVRVPWLQAGDDPAVWSPDTGIILAERALHRTAAAARALGAQILERTAVEHVAARTGAVTLHTANGVVRARSVVVAAGGWAPPILDGLGIAVPLGVTCEQILYFRPHDPDRVPDAVFIHWGDIHRYGLPAAGSAPGYKVGEHGTGRVVAADRRDFDLAEPEAERLRAYVRTALPGLEPHEIAYDTCLYTSTPSQDFVIDAKDQTVVASACSGHGFKFAPLAGEIIACLVTGTPPPADADRFAFAAFS